MAGHCCLDDVPRLLCGRAHKGEIFRAAIAAALFPLGTSFYEVEGVPVSVDPEGANARAWDIPGSRHFPLPLDHSAEPLSEEDFLRRMDALLNP